MPSSISRFPTNLDWADTNGVVKGRYEGAVKMLFARWDAIPALQIPNLAEYHSGGWQRDGMRGY